MPELVSDGRERWLPSNLRDILSDESGMSPLRSGNKLQERYAGRRSRSAAAV